MSFLGDVANNTVGMLGRAAGDAYSNITGVGRNSTSQNFSNLWGEQSGGGTSNPNPNPSPSPSPTPTPATDPSVQANINAINAQSAAIRAQIASQPKLIYRDTNAAWQNAQNTAASSVNPVYQDNLNREITKQANALTQQQQANQATAAAGDTALANTQADIATTADRSTQDTANTIAQNQQQEGNWQTTEGTQADTAENAARLALGDQGIEGKGAGALEGSQMTRNQASDQQTTQFQNQRDTAQMLNTRTLADLNTKGNQAVQLNATQKTDLDRQLNDFITNQGTDMNNFKASNESGRLNALFSATQQQYGTDTAKWLASLVQGGARAQDVQLASQVYK